MELNFIISFVIGFIIAIIFSLEKVRLKFINITLNIFIKLNERKKNKLLNKVLFSKNLKERTKAMKELEKMKAPPNHKKLINNIIKFSLIYIAIVSTILITIGYVINSTFHSPFGYLAGWFIGFIAMFIKSKFF